MTRTRHAMRRSNLDDRAVEGCSCPFCGAPISPDTQSKIEARVNAMVAEAESGARERALHEQGAAATRAADAMAKLKQSVATEVERARRDAMKQAAEALAPKIAEAVNEERKKTFAEKLSLEQQLEDMKRKLQNKTAHQIGEPAEVDLHAVLQTTFKEDLVTRVPKGCKGADVVIQVMHRGRPVGKLVIDSKNHRRWSNKFTQKLRADQADAKADFAILSSSVFPAGKEQIHVQDNVIVADPARVPVVVELLRRMVIQSDMLKLNQEGRTEKADELLRFMTSDSCWNHFESIAKLSAEIEEIDRAETVQHKKVWAKRAELNRGLADSYRQFAGSIDSILGGTGHGET